MGCVRYVVLKGDDGYEVQLRGRNFGPYPTQSDAVGAAVRVAEHLAQEGQEAEVLVQGDGEPRKEWPRSAKPEAKQRPSLLSALLRGRSTLH
jgi:hypothetical protein